MKLFLFLLFITVVNNPIVSAQSYGLDLSFGNKGIIDDYPQITESGFNNVFLQPDSKIIADNHRFNKDGSLDESYKNMADASLPMAIQQDGKLLCFSVAEIFKPSQLTCLFENGTTDSSFGNEGFVKINDTTLPIVPFAVSKILIQSDNKILLLGKYTDGWTIGIDEMPVVIFTPPNITMRRYLPTLTEESLVREKTR